MSRFNLPKSTDWTDSLSSQKWHFLTLYLQGLTNANFQLKRDRHTVFDLLVLALSLFPLPRCLSMVFLGTFTAEPLTFPQRFATFRTGANRDLLDDPLGQIEVLISGIQ